jgi:hypothetical protein
MYSMLGPFDCAFGFSTKPDQAWLGRELAAGRPLVGLPECVLCMPFLSTPTIEA